jgi:Glycosyl transferases group 1
MLAVPGLAVSAERSLSNMYRQSEEMDQPRVLVFSQRELAHGVLFRCPHWEFEDLICEMDAADVLAPEAGKGFSLRTRIAKRFAWHSPIALNPGVKGRRIEKKYELLLAICGSPVDLLSLNAIEGWRTAARVSVCVIDEMWLTELDAYKYFLRLLENFDAVMLYYSQGVETISKAISRRCVFMPPGVDSIRFCPYPDYPDRVIDVLSIGRRSSRTHRALLEMSKKYDLFYLHDSVMGNRAIDATEHRELLASMAKRSRYFVVNPASVDQYSLRGGQSEIGNRYFEGAAAGAVLIGECPQNEEFRRLFDWPDAVLRLPYDSEEVEPVIRALDANPGAQEMIRSANVANSLLRHDWAYRWESVLRTVGLEALPGLEERKARLRHLAAQVLSGREAQSRVV